MKKGIHPKILKVIFVKKDGSSFNIFLSKKPFKVGSKVKKKIVFL